MKLSDILSGHVGVAESRVRDVFKEAMQYAPAVVFIDEFQALFVSRGGEVRGNGGAGSTLTSTLAGCLDDISAWNANAGVNSLVTIIGATNEPWAIDAGFLRPGRFDKILYVGPMNISERCELISAHIHKLRKVLCVDLDPTEIASRTEGFTAADIGYLFQNIADEFMSSYCTIDKTRSDYSPKQRHESLSMSSDMLSVALGRAHPSCSSREVEEYIEWEAERNRHICG